MYNYKNQRNHYPLVILVFLLLGVGNSSYGQYHLQLLDDPSIDNFHVMEDMVEAYYKDVDKATDKGYKQWKKWAHFNEGRFGPSGDFIDYQKIINKEYLKLKYAYADNELRSTHGYWEVEGPTEWVAGAGGDGGIGRINVFAKDPTNNDRQYIGSGTGCVWKTTDDGATWTNQSFGFPTFGIAGIVVDHINPQNVYALTGDGDQNGPGMGVMKSTDYGHTWALTGQAGFWTSENGFKLLMHPTDPNIIFAVTSDKLCKTVNGGSTWETLVTGKFTDVEFKPGDPSTVYACARFSLYRSTSNGDLGTWTTINDSDFPSFNDFTRMAIAVAPSYPDLVYVLFGGGTTAFFRSLDSGSSFDLRVDNSMGTNEILSNQCNLMGSVDQSSYNMSMVVNPTNYNEVFVGGILLFKSLNGGLDWFGLGDACLPNSAYIHADFHNLSYEGSELYACTDGGLFYSLNNGSDFIDESNGISNMQIGVVDVAGNNYGLATQDNGCNSGTIGSDLVTHIIGGDGVAIALDYNDPDIIYAGSQLNRFRVTDSGMNSTNITPVGETGWWGPDMVIDVLDPDILFLAEVGKIFRTFDAPNVTPTSWQSLVTGFASGSNESAVRSMSQCQGSVNALYAITKQEARRSFNIRAANPSFTNITSGLPVATTDLASVSVDPNFDLRAYVSCLGYVAGNKVYKTDNGGTTWTNISLNLPNVQIMRIIADDKPENGLYVGTELGVFYKNDNMSEWIPFQNGMPATTVMDLDIDGNKIYAATWGSGLYSSDLYSSCTSLSLSPLDDPSPANYTGAQIYHAATSLSSSRIITGGEGTDVQYYSENYIDLTTGFWVKENNLFVAKNENCPE